MFIIMKIDQGFLGEPGETNALVYRRTPYCPECATTAMTLDLFRMFDPVDQDESDLFRPIAQAYAEAVLQRAVVVPGTRCRRCGIEFAAPAPGWN